MWHIFKGVSRLTHYYYKSEVSKYVSYYFITSKLQNLLDTIILEMLWMVIFVAELFSIYINWVDPVFFITGMYIGYN